MRTWIGEIEGGGALAETIGMTEIAETEDQEDTGITRLIGTRGAKGEGEVLGREETKEEILEERGRRHRRAGTVVASDLTRLLRRKINRKLSWLQLHRLVLKLVRYRKPKAFSAT